MGFRHVKESLTAPKFTSPNLIGTNAGLFNGTFSKRSVELCLWKSDHLDPVLTIVATITKVHTLGETNFEQVTTNGRCLLAAKAARSGNDGKLPF